MPPPSPSDHVAFRLRLLDNLYFVKQLKIDETIPPEFIAALTNSRSRKFISITRTDEEISIVGEVGEGDGDSCAEWRCIKITGPMDFGVTGVMSNFTAPLKAAGVPIFAVSTWNTDYVLVPKEKADEAVGALSGDGWTFGPK